MNQNFNIDKPPADWDLFLAEATDVFVRKDADYDSRFMRGMIDLDAKTLWAWEVDKKLDRIRTWTKRGELQVKGEGVSNSVIDLFNYTVQYFYLTNSYHVSENQNKEEFLKLWQYNREQLFFKVAYNYSIAEWLQFLKTTGRIAADEQLLLLTLRAYMGDRIVIKDYQKAIRSILS
ncbi:hypothetical protein [Bacillus amyloliquefaciens]|uniref:hypothetical protein n=1 Tax=Bacillus amyloliquefaciens TaxID=1390 RepID=UPI002DBD7AC9|nr:hypothetical protein [Bacillus amyloliquefaciens]MEC3841527.1 hypothetical protein [Bacillus amyloliquefaciens]